MGVCLFDELIIGDEYIILYWFKLIVLINFMFIFFVLMFDVCWMSLILGSIYFMLILMLWSCYLVDDGIDMWN